MKTSGELRELGRLFGIAFLAAISLLGCQGGGGSSDGGTTPPVTYTATGGVAQKGPLQQGSIVTAQELNATLAPTGQQYTYQITSNLGTFAPTSTFGSRYIGLNAIGYYFDEVTNAVSAGTITLNAYNDLAVDSILNVNLLTTLAYQRIQNLVTNSGMSLANARAQAEREVLAAFNIRNASSYGTFGSFDLSKGTDGSQILAVISSLFVNGNTSGNLSALVANVQSDIGTNGAITNASTRATLAASARAINPVAIAANLNQLFGPGSVSLSAADLARWLDQDGDGVVGKFEFTVPDANQASVFPLPTSVTDLFAGTSISASTGSLSVNGTLRATPVTIASGDVVAVSPPAGAFPQGVLPIYLLSGTNRVARVSFVGGLALITVTPATPGIPRGLTQQFTATGTYTDSSTADVSGSVTWTSSTPASLTVNSATGLARAVASGSSTITATSGSVSGSTVAGVTAAVLASLAVTPGSATSGVGYPVQMTASGTYSDGSVANATNAVAWSSSQPSVATVNASTGLTIGVSTGTTTITASSGAISGSATLTVAGPGWLPAGTLAQPRANHTATLLGNGKVLVAGGSNLSGTLVATAELYDPATNTWSAAGGLAHPRRFHTATLLASGKVLVAGGEDGQPGLVASEIYDPATNTWGAGANLTTARSFHTATLLPNGKVLLAGGTCADGLSGVTCSSTTLFDPVANTWSAAAAMGSPRTQFTATLLSSGLVLAAGGQNLPTSHMGIAQAELYNPQTNSWSAAGSLVTPVWSHSATLLANGKVLVAGGRGAGNPPTTAAALYDPVANSWSSVAAMSTPRYARVAALLSNGKVLVTGGTDSVPSAEVFDPATQTWSSTDSPAAANSFALTSLPNGVVLISGGIGNGALVAGAELYQ